MKIARIFLPILMFLVWSSTGYGQDVKPVLALSFDDGKGNVARDLSGNGFHGKVDGAKWVDGKFGKALEFDGVDDFVEVDDAPELRLLKGGMLMAWAFIKGEKGHPSWPRILPDSRRRRLKRGAREVFSVAPRGKVTTTWAEIKRG